MTSLMEAILAEIKNEMLERPDTRLDREINLSYRIASDIVRRNFVALSVDEIARLVSGYEPLLWNHMGDISKQEHVEKATAIMKRLRG